MLVKKYVSIFLLAVYMLSTNSELLELVKLPILVEHFIEHKQWDPRISFLKFMYIHYFEDNDDNKYGDQARDMQMPFKTTCHSSVEQVGFIIPSPDFAVIPRTIFKDRKQKLFADPSPYSSQYLSSIWQPPRSC